MAARPQDWFRQGERDLAHARRALEDGDYEWACFACQQAAEKAVKAVYQHRRIEAWGHAVSALLETLRSALPQDQATTITSDLVDLARELDKHYIPTRYPDAHPQGAPFEFYTHAEAERSISQAERLFQLCADLLAR
ncbi:MAG: HEPN domain-containing protein [Chloroflexota bacterium]